jgi:hypothetical protein
MTYTNGFPKSFIDSIIYTSGFYSKKAFVRRYFYCTEMDINLFSVIPYCYPCFITSGNYCNYSKAQTKKHYYGF